MAGIYDDKIVGLKEQRDFARNLRMQPNNQPMGQMVSGHYVPNIGGAIAGAIGNIMGGYQEGQANEKLDTAQRQKIADTIRYMNQAGVEAPQGLAQQAETPAQSPSLMDRAGALFSGNAQPQGTPAQAYQQNVAQNVNPDVYEKALSGLISVNPEQAAPMAAMYQARTNREAAKAEHDYAHERNKVNDEFNQQKFGIEQANIMQRAQEANDMRRSIAALAQSNRQEPQGTSTIRNPDNPDEMIIVNSATGRKIGVAGAEPKALIRQEKEQAKIDVAKNAKQSFQTSLEGIGNEYKNLNSLGSIKTDTNSSPANALKVGFNTNVGKLLGTETGTSLSNIEEARRTLVQDFKKAAEMGSGQLNSNFELENALKIVTDPNSTYEAVQDQINTLSNKYGTGQAVFPKRVKFKQAANAIQGLTPKTEIPTAPVSPDDELAQLRAKHGG